MDVLMHLLLRVLTQRVSNRSGGFQNNLELLEMNGMVLGICDILLYGDPSVSHGGGIHLYNIDVCCHICTN